jgi:hypothetical protein
MIIFCTRKGKSQNEDFYTNCCVEYLNLGEIK